MELLGKYPDGIYLLQKEINQFFEEGVFQLKAI